MVSRNQKPQVEAMPSLQLPNPTLTHLNKALPLFVYAQEKSPTTVLDIFWRAGERYGEKAIPYMMGKMLTEGAGGQSSHALAAALEQYGSQLSIHIHKEVIHLKLSAIPRYLEKALPTLQAILCAPTFAQKPLQKVQRITLERCKQQMADPSFVAQKALKRLLFGDQHPYGYTLNAEDVSHTTPEQLHAYYQSHAWNQPLLYLSGEVLPSHLPALTKSFGHMVPKNQPPPHRTKIIGKKEASIVLPSSLQSTLTMGHHSLTQSHPDYPALFITNTVLGGYFGSRLMQKIREEKGYTYGIYSLLTPWIEEGYWWISTHVKKEVQKATQEDILNEIKKLQSTLMPQKELETVKNYLMGQLLALFQTPHALADRLAHTTLHGLDLKYYNQLYETIQKITPETIQATAKKYFDIERLHFVSVVPPQ